MGGTSDIPLSDNDFKNFLIKNNVVTTAVAITIGISSASFVKSFVVNVMMPGLYILIGNIILKNINNTLYQNLGEMFGEKAFFDFDNLAKDMITWILIVIASYLILEYVIRRWFLGGKPKIVTTPSTQPMFAFLGAEQNKSHTPMIDFQQPRISPVQVSPPPAPVKRPYPQSSQYMLNNLPAGYEYIPTFNNRQ